MAEMHFDGVEAAVHQTTGSVCEGLRHALEIFGCHFLCSLHAQGIEKSRGRESCQPSAGRYRTRVPDLSGQRSTLGVDGVVIQ